MAQTQISKNNTRIVKSSSDIISVWLYNTEIVIIYPLYVFLNNGGYNTVTTQTRMNQASNQYGLGYFVSRRNGYMMATKGGTTYNFDSLGRCTLPR